MKSCNRTYREDVLDLYRFRTLDQVLEMTHCCLDRYNEARRLDSLGDLSPLEYAKHSGFSTYERST